MDSFLEKVRGLMSRRLAQYFVTGLLVAIGMLIASPQHAWAQG
jgi:hypothetical protein